MGKNSVDYCNYRQNGSYLYEEQSLLVPSQAVCKIGCN